ncbi:MAG: Ig-like domain-containing protein, partial [Gemmatimonadetes bacterium]|nr:Ig-like domain-containing protein [Gemmatimonadota bacterium]
GTTSVATAQALAIPVIAGGTAALLYGGVALARLGPVPRDVAPIERLQWSTSDPRIAQVTGEGRVVAVSPGLVTITASTGEHFASTTLTVTREALVSGATPLVSAQQPGTLIPARARESRITPSPAAVEPAPPPRPRQRRMVAIALGVVILGGIAAATMLLTGDAETGDASTIVTPTDPTVTDADQPVVVAPPPAAPNVAAADSAGGTGTATTGTRPDTTRRVPAVGQPGASGNRRPDRCICTGRNRRLRRVSMHVDALHL